MERYSYMGIGSRNSNGFTIVAQHRRVEVNEIDLTVTWRP